MYICRECKKEFTTKGRNKKICPSCIGKIGGKRKQIKSWPNVIKEKKAKLGKHGYLYYTKSMCTPEEIDLLPGSGRIILLHRLIYAKNYNMILDKDAVVMHINGNKQDNKIENLQLGTDLENIRQHWDAIIDREKSKHLAAWVLLALT